MAESRLEELKSIEKRLEKYDTVIESMNLNQRSALKDNQEIKYIMTRLKVLSDKPSNEELPLILSLHGTIRYICDQPQEALKMFNTALGYDKTNPKYLAKRGEVLAYLGKYEDAIESLFQAVTSLKSWPEKIEEFHPKFSLDKLPTFDGILTPTKEKLSVEVSEQDGSIMLFSRLRLLAGIGDSPANALKDLARAYWEDLEKNPEPLDVDKLFE